MNMKKNNLFINLILIAIVICLTALPLIILKDAEFDGADSQAEEAISEINADYKPWISTLFKPASGEVESLLFALQAAIGAGIIGYGLGYMKGQSKK